MISDFCLLPCFQSFKLISLKNPALITHLNTGEPVFYTFTKKADYITDYNEPFILGNGCFVPGQKQRREKG